MAKLQNYNGRYCEWEFEYTFLALLEEEGWQYLAGNSIPRNPQRGLVFGRFGAVFKQDESRLDR